MKDERLTVERLVSDNAHTFQDERKRLNISKSIFRTCLHHRRNFDLLRHDRTLSVLLGHRAQNCEILRIYVFFL